MAAPPIPVTAEPVPAGPAFDDTTGSGSARTDPESVKKGLRLALRRERAGLTALEREMRSAAAAHRAIAFLTRPDGGISGPVSLFRSLPQEIDTGPLVSALSERGVDLLLPRQVGRGLPLSLHHWAPGEPLHVGPFAVEEPPADAPTGHPATMIVPLLAFDEDCDRLGYGGGFYDRTIEALGRTARPPLCVGLAFDLQRVPEVPTARYDRTLDAVITETRTIVRRESAAAVPG